MHTTFTITFEIFPKCTEATWKLTERRPLGSKALIPSPLFSCPTLSSCPTLASDTEALFSNLPQCSWTAFSGHQRSNIYVDPGKKA